MYIFERISLLRLHLLRQRNLKNSGELNDSSGDALTPSESKLLRGFIAP